MVLLNAYSGSRWREIRGVGVEPPRREHAPCIPCIPLICKPLYDSGLKNYCFPERGRQCTNISKVELQLVYQWKWYFMK
jgi:hypothetical protein